MVFLLGTVPFKGVPWNPRNTCIKYLSIAYFSASVSPIKTEIFKILEPFLYLYLQLLDVYNTVFNET